jgi:hypothetical protein
MMLARGAGVRCWEAEGGRHEDGGRMSHSCRSTAPVSLSSSWAGTNGRQSLVVPVASHPAGPASSAILTYRKLLTPHALSSKTHPQPKCRRGSAIERIAGHLASFGLTHGASLTTTQPLQHCSISKTGSHVCQNPTVGFCVLHPGYSRRHVF